MNVPDLGAESITEGTVMEWRVEVGGFVKKGDVIAVIETDKVTVEVNAPESGVLEEILVKVDETAEIGKPFCKIRPGAEGAAPTTPAPAAAATPAPAAAAAPAPAAPAAAASGKPVEMKVPDFGAESITEGSMMEWNFKVGDFVKKGDLLVSIETDKITIEVNAQESGILQSVALKEGDTAEVGKPLCSIIPGGAPSPSAQAPAPKKVASPAPAPSAPASPKAAPSKPEPAKTPPAAAPSPGGGREERRTKMSRMRLKIASRLKEAQNTTAMLTTFQEVDMTGIMQLR